jgi:hypothetical protein
MVGFPAVARMNVPATCDMPLTRTNADLVANEMSFDCSNAGAASAQNRVVTLAGSAYTPLVANVTGMPARINGVGMISTQY